MAGLLESIPLWTALLIVVLTWLIPFLWAMNHLVKLKRPLAMKALWAFACVVLGIIGVAIYVAVVYFPEKRKQQLSEKK